MPTITETRSPWRLGATLLAGEPGALPKVASDAWYGQTDCAVGPFPARRVAEHYAQRLVDVGMFDVASRRIFLHLSGWFVEVRPLSTAD